ncbi:MAG: response regulator [Syntrophales bacterium]|nr:response regulator [Syntrophales bacterium]
MAVKKLLIIDDEPDLCRVLKKNLEALGDFEVFTATDGTDGLKLAKKERPDLILLDIIMPDMSGTEVAEELLEHPLTRTIPIIFVTAIVSQSEMLDSDGYIGNRLFIPKPIDMDDLLVKINTLLEGTAR